MWSQETTTFRSNQSRVFLLQQISNYRTSIPDQDERRPEKRKLERALIILIYFYIFFESVNHRPQNPFHSLPPLPSFSISRQPAWKLLRTYTTYRLSAQDTAWSKPDKNTGPTKEKCEYLEAQEKRRQSEEPKRTPKPTSNSQKCVGTWSQDKIRESQDIVTDKFLTNAT